jgi:hypothetical protein
MPAPKPLGPVETGPMMTDRAQHAGEAGQPPPLSGAGIFPFPLDIPAHHGASQDSPVPHGSAGIDKDGEPVRTEDPPGAAPGSDSPGYALLCADFGLVVLSGQATG